MTSSRPNRPEYEFGYKIPVLDEEVANACVDGVYTIPQPTLKKSKLVIDDEAKCGTIQVRCNSCFVKHPDTVCKCNSTVKTIVGGGTGDQCEIVECGKCRTSYLIRTIYDKDGHLKLNISVWDTGRNIKAFSRREHNQQLDFQLRFNDDEELAAKLANKSSKPN